MPQVIEGTTYVPPLSLEVWRLDKRALLPRKHYESDAGWDLFAFTYMGSNPNPSKIMVPSRGVRPVPTRIALRPPPGHFAMVSSRSGLARDRVLFVANSPGIVDPEYTGEIIVLIYNGGYEPYWINHEDRIGQIILLPLPRATLIEVNSLPETKRGEKGFGSTGR